MDKTKNSMKLVQIITSLSTGGAENLVVESSLKYEERGIKLDIVSLKNSDTPFSKKLRNSFRGNVIGLTKGNVYNPFLIFKLIFILKEYQIAHVHLFPTLYWVVLAKWLSFSSTKIIYTEHSTNNRRRESTLFKYIDRFIYRGVDKIVTISDEVDKNLKFHLNFNNDYFTLINNGINLEKFQNSGAYSKSEFFENDDIFLLIQVSSFRYPKDQVTLIKALKSLPEKYKLLLVGDGILRDESECLVNKLGLNQRVKFLGLRTDIPELLNTVDLIILSSNYEGLSLSSIEGMACKPFIASNVPGLREIVEGAGLLFEPGNSKELAHHIQNLSNDADYYNKIAEQCKRRAQQFDLNTMVDQYIKVYKKVLDEN